MLEAQTSVSVDLGSDLAVGNFRNGVHCRRLLTHNLMPAGADLLDCELAVHIRSYVLVPPCRIRLEVPAAIADMLLAPPARHWRNLVLQ